MSASSVDMAIGKGSEQAHKLRHDLDQIAELTGVPWRLDDLDRRAQRTGRPWR